MKVRGGRSMLNKPGYQTTGAMIAEIQDTRKWKRGKGRNGKSLTEASFGLYGQAEPDCSLHFMDCTRSVSFDFEFATKGDRENNLYKVNTMISLLEEFRDALEDEQRLYMRRKKFVKE